MEKKKEEEKTSFEQMAEDIKQIRNALNRLNNLGISRELMSIYICHKTKMGRYKVDAVLDAQKEFLRNAIKE
jgi:hypothetical protein